MFAVPDYQTQWGSDTFKGKVLTIEMTVVRLTRKAGAVVIAKLATGELASGDQWFGGRTNNPWSPSEGSSGSSAGPASATAAGPVAVRSGKKASGVDFEPAPAGGWGGLPSAVVALSPTR